MTTALLPLSHKDWLAEAERRFGPDPMLWRFVCPACHHVATVKDWKDAGAPEGGAAFSCVGRWTNATRDAFARSGKGPCNYAGGGLFPLNPQPVVMENGATRHAFAFAEVSP